MKEARLLIVGMDDSSDFTGEHRLLFEASKRETPAESAAPEGKQATKDSFAEFVDAVKKLDGKDRQKLGNHLMESVLKDSKVDTEKAKTFLAVVHAELERVSGKSVAFPSEMIDRDALLRLARRTEMITLDQALSGPQTKASSQRSSPAAAQSTAVNRNTSSQTVAPRATPTSFSPIPQRNTVPPAFTPSRRFAPTSRVLPPPQTASRTRSEFPALEGTPPPQVRMREQNNTAEFSLKDDIKPFENPDVTYADILGRPSYRKAKADFDEKMSFATSVLQQGKINIALYNAERDFQVARLAKAAEKIRVTPMEAEKNDDQKKPAALDLQPKEKKDLLQERVLRKIIFPVHDFAGDAGVILEIPGEDADGKKTKQEISINDPRLWGKGMFFGKNSARFAFEQGIRISAEREGSRVKGMSVEFLKPGSFIVKTKKLGGSAFVVGQQIETIDVSKDGSGESEVFKLQKEEVRPTVKKIQTAQSEQPREAIKETTKGFRQKLPDGLYRIVYERHAPPNTPVPASPFPEQWDRPASVYPQYGGRRTVLIPQPNGTTLELPIYRDSTQQKEEPTSFEEGEVVTLLNKYADPVQVFRVGPPATVRVTPEQQALEQAKFSEAKQFPNTWVTLRSGVPGYQYCAAFDGKLYSWRPSDNTYQVFNEAISTWKPTKWPPTPEKNVDKAPPQASIETTVPPRARSYEENDTNVNNAPPPPLDAGVKDRFVPEKEDVPERKELKSRPKSIQEPSPQPAANPAPVLKEEPAPQPNIVPAPPTETPVTPKAAAPQPKKRPSLIAEYESKQQMKKSSTIDAYERREEETAKKVQKEDEKKDLKRTGEIRTELIVTRGALAKIAPFNKKSMEASKIYRTLEKAKSSDTEALAKAKKEYVDALVAEQNIIRAQLDLGRLFNEDRTNEVERLKVIDRVIDELNPPSRPLSPGSPGQVA